MSTPPPPTSRTPSDPQEALREVIESISSELELRPLLTDIVRRACDLLRAERGSVGLVDADKGVLRTEAVYRMPPDEMGSEMPPGVGLAGKIWETGEPMILGRYGDLDRPALDGVDEDVVVGVPIEWRSELIGFLGIGALAPHQFDEADVELLSQFARHAAIAITNARLVEAERRRALRMETIARVGRLVTGSLSLDDVLRNAVESVERYLNCFSAGLFLVDSDDSSLLVLIDRQGVEADVGIGQYSQRLGEGIIGIAARDRAAVLVPDVHSDPRYVGFPGEERSRIQSELATPIVLGDRLLGVINIETERKLDGDDVDGMEVIADELAIAIENARLYAGSERALGDTRLLLEIAQAMSVAEGVAGVSSVFLERLGAECGLPCEVSLLREEGDVAEVIARYDPRAHAELPAEHAVPIDRALRQELEREPLVRRSLFAAAEDDGPASEELLYPLRVHRRTLGWVRLVGPAGRCDLGLAMLRLTAGQLATALDHRAHQTRAAEQAAELAALAERHRLAADLHDSVNQVIFSISLMAQSIAPAWRESDEEGERRAERLVELTQAARVEMRALLTELRPPAEPVAESAPLSDLGRIEQSGLVAALRHHCDRFASDGLEVRLDAASYGGQPIEREVTLFRVAQEALNNVMKHSHAGRVELRLTSAGDGSCRMVVADDGRGFENPAGTVEGGGMGLATMSERARRVGGTLEIESAVGVGTRVRVTLPPT